MRDAVNLSDIAFKQGYTYQGVYLCENGEIYVKLRHISGTTVNVHQKQLNQIIS
jgi:hypothetical protein